MAVLPLLHFVYHCDVLWHLHVAIFMQFLSQVMRQPMLKAATQLSVVPRFKMSGAIHLLLYAIMVWCLLYRRSNLTFYLPLHTHFLSRSKSLACQRGVILGVCEALEHPKLGQRAANELIKLLEVLASHSITSYELKRIFLLLREDADFHVS
jgi:hypothetical protein